MANNIHNNTILTTRTTMTRITNSTHPSSPSPSLLPSSPSSLSKKEEEKEGSMKVDKLSTTSHGTLKHPTISAAAATTTTTTVSTSVDAMALLHSSLVSVMETETLPSTRTNANASASASASMEDEDKDDHRAGQESLDVRVEVDKTGETKSKTKSVAWSGAGTGGGKESSDERETRVHVYVQEKKTTSTMRTSALVNANEERGRNQKVKKTRSMLGYRSLRALFCDENGGSGQESSSSNSYPGSRNNVDAIGSNLNEHSSRKQNRLQRQFSFSPSHSHRQQHQNEKHLKHMNSFASIAVRRKRSEETVMSSNGHNNNAHFITIRPRHSGVFTPQLPTELWLVIFRYAVEPPFVVGGTASVQSSRGASASASAQSPYPYSSTGSTSSTTTPSSVNPTPEPEPVSFLNRAPAHTHLGTRIAQYNAHLKWKASLTRVCRIWNWIAQEVLYEDIWIAKGREARALAERLCGDGGFGFGLGTSLVEVEVTSNVAVQKPEKTTKLIKKKKKDGAVQGLQSLIPGRKRAQTGGPNAAAATTTTTVTRALSRKPSVDHSSSSPNNVGRFVRRIHVETRAMEKCSPHDLLLILQYCPNLEVYEDYKSVRRPMHPLALSVSPIAPFSSYSTSVSSGLYGSSTTVTSTTTTHAQGLLTPDALLHTLLSRPLKKLSWTNYDYDPTDFDAGVGFYEDFVAPRLAGVAGSKLEFLEISLSGLGVHGFGSTGGSVSARGGRRRLTVPAMRMDVGVNASLLTHLSADLVGSSSSFPTSSHLSLASSSSPSSEYSLASASSPSSQSIDGFMYSILLPALRSLKVTLDNATFMVLSTWNMPLLTHLSVLSADFGYSGTGFRRFFEVHGEKIVQLELGHSSGDIEEAWLTAPPVSHNPVAAPGGGANAQSPPTPANVPLNAWCPNLKEFICSADAEWNWQSPDWIAPHVLLPTHAGLVFIGVRDMEKRLITDADDALRRRRGDVGGVIHQQNQFPQQHQHGQGQVQGGGILDEDPYFMLLEQFGSLLRSEAFPCLRYVRDMSWESDIYRRTGRMSLLSSPSSSSSSLDSPGLSPSSAWSSSSSASGSSNVPRWFAPSSSLSPPPPTSSSGRRLLSKASPAALSLQAHADAEARANGAKVLEFWSKVLRRCRERGVWLEDCRGVNVTMGDLRRAGLDVV